MEQILPAPFTQSFIDQACSIKMAGYWPHSVCPLTDLDSVSVLKYAKKGTFPISSQLDLILMVRCAKRN